MGRNSRVFFARGPPLDAGRWASRFQLAVFCWTTAGCREHFLVRRPFGRMTSRMRDERARPKRCLLEWRAGHEDVPRPGIEPGTFRSSV